MAKGEFSSPVPFTIPEAPLMYLLHIEFHFHFHICTFFGFFIFVLSICSNVYKIYFFFIVDVGRSYKEG